MLRKTSAFPVRQTRTFWRFQNHFISNE